LIGLWAYFSLVLMLPGERGKKERGKLKRYQRFGKGKKEGKRGVCGTSFSYRSPIPSVKKEREPGKRGKGESGKEDLKSCPRRSLNALQHQFAQKRGKSIRRGEGGGGKRGHAQLRFFEGSL